jgi:hypothetical protein
MLVALKEKCWLRKILIFYNSNLGGFNCLLRNDNKENWGELGQIIKSAKPSLLCIIPGNYDK